MKILQVSKYDYLGGAARVAWSLFSGYRSRGLSSALAVDVKSVEDPAIIQIDNSGLFWRIARAAELQFGLERMCFPGTSKLLKISNFVPDIFHAHNLHSGYFNLYELPRISARIPTVLTLHDTWLLTGHCAYFIDCNRWKVGCGQCPDLRRYPAVRRDGTALGWKRKRNIFAKSHLYLATPSQWLLNQVEQSILVPAIKKSRVINNGVDLQVYKPGNKEQLRQEFDLHVDDFVILYVASSKIKKSVYKDYQTIDLSLDIIADKMPKNKRLVFLGLGEKGDTQVLGNCVKRFIPYQTDPTSVAKYYQVADVYVHAANADTFPNVILESLACGTPVIATDVGGVNEQVIDGYTGFLVPQKDASAISERVLQLIYESDYLYRISENAAHVAVERYSQDKMIINYLEFYNETLDDFHAIKGV